MEKRFMSDPFYFRVKGEYALFTDPTTKGGGEKFTYQLPTYQALKGIAEAIYWKPTLVCIIDSVKVINKIRTESIGVRALKQDYTSDLNYYTYLCDVDYFVKFHFEWNLNRKDLEQDRNLMKHQEMLLRSLSKGGRRDIFLGTRECIGHVERITKEQYDNCKLVIGREGAYDSSSASFGMMFHSFSYPGESYKDNNNLIALYSNIIMRNGEINFVRPEDCTVHNIIGNYSIKQFDKDNVKFVDLELGEMNKAGQNYEL